MRFAVRPISNTWSDFDRAFNELTQGFFEGPVKSGHADFIPPVEVYEDEEYYGVSFDLPGFTVEDLQIDVVEDRLEVKGERKKQSQSEQVGSFFTEKTYGKFHRSLQLPKNASRDDVTADFKDGVLSLKIRKVEQLSSRRIEIAS
jgi:HSP20 family protein